METTEEEREETEETEETEAAEVEGEEVEEEEETDSKVGIQSEIWFDQLCSASSFKIKLRASILKVSNLKPQVTA